MKKKIAILGSTGSIGKSLLKILLNDKKSFAIKLLTAKKNYKLLLKQAKEFNVKNIIITDNKYYKIALSKKVKSIKIHNSFNELKKILPNKVDYVMSSIVGLDGLAPTVNIIKHTKKIAIANKESIICAWNIIQKELIKYKTQFIPVDSEHFSIWYALKNYPNARVNKIYLTASGGALLNIPKNKLNKININQVLKHPNWKMGKKITTDSSTLMNKVFEIIEAKKIFNLKYNQLGIIIHPESYVHAIIKFNNGMIKIIAHDTTMQIPIANTVYGEQKNLIIKTKSIDFDKLSKMSFYEPSIAKFPIIKVLKSIPNRESLFETAIVAANDELVKLFLNKKISYNMISKTMNQITNKKDFIKLKKSIPRNISDIVDISIKIQDKIRAKN